VSCKRHGTWDWGTWVTRLSTHGCCKDAWGWLGFDVEIIEGSDHYTRTHGLTSILESAVILKVKVTIFAVSLFTDRRFWTTGVEFTENVTINS
jgi:hypothetical protein